MGIVGILSFLFAFQSHFAFSADLYNEIEDSKIGIVCKAEGTSLAFCTYERKYADAQQILTQSNYDIGKLFGQPGFIPEEEGYVRIGKNAKTITFSFKDPKLMEDFKKYLISIDETSAPTKNREAHFKLDVYLVSTQKASETGFNLEFLKDGVVAENTPRVQSLDNILNWNIGNLTNQMLSLTFHRANTTGVVISNESLVFAAEHGASSPITSSQIFYRDGKSLSTDQESGVRNLTGTVSLDPKNPKRIVFINFNFQFYLPILKDTSMIRTIAINKPALYLESGVQQILVSNDETTQSISKETGILSLESARSFNQFKIVASIVGFADEEEENRFSNFEQARNLYTFNTEKIEKMPEGTAADVAEALRVENLNHKVIKSPIGYLGEAIALQIKPNQITKSMLQARILVTVKAKGLKPKPTSLSLENLLAGPLLLDSNFFDVYYLIKNKDGKIPFQLTVSEDPAYAKKHRSLGVQPFNNNYDFIYNLKSGTLDLISR